MKANWEAPLVYLVMFACAFVAHACAVEFDLQADPAPATARQV
ncbi:hypothetical protein PO002_05105 [Cupriavidus necator]